MSPESVLVFAGPSLPPSLRRRWPAVEWRGPVTAGDAIDLLADPPASVVLIDGLFDQVPAIRHKELLMLMARGVTVFGAASMGALRAAELSAHGMIGVGAIFTAFHRDRLRGDDEVALLHGPAALDWAPWTVPLVNVRATLLAAVRQRVIEAGAARGLLNAALAIFYQDRRWDTVLAEARALPGQRHAEFDRFSAWLETDEVDLKQRDAVACVDLAVAGVDRGAGSEPPMTLFTEALVASRNPQASA